MKIENVSDLAMLVQTARTGSLTRAGAVLGISPAAASAMLKRLELQLGVRLFERSTRAMRLTSQGQTMLDYATRAFELLDEAESLVLSDRAGLTGTLRVAAPSDLCRTILMPWLDEFLAAHPNLQLKLSVGDQMLDVVRDEVDVAIRYGDLRDSGLIAYPLLMARPIVTAAPAYLARCGTPAMPADLARHNCIVFGQGGSAYRDWRFAHAGVSTTVRVSGDRSVDDASLARDWAVAGAGILFKSALEQQQALASGALVRLLPEWEADIYPLHALVPSGRFLPQRVRRFVEFMIGKFGAGGV